MTTMGAESAHLPISSAILCFAYMVFLFSSISFFFCLKRRKGQEENSEKGENHHHLNTHTHARTKRERERTRETREHENRQRVSPALSKWNNLKCHQPKPILTGIDFLVNLFVTLPIRLNNAPRFLTFNKYNSLLQRRRWAASPLRRNSPNRTSHFSKTTPNSPKIKSSSGTKVSS